MMKELAMAILLRITILVLLPTIALAQLNVRAAKSANHDTFTTQLIVVVRDAKTRQILVDPRVDLEDAHGSASFWGDGICRVELAGGTYRMKVVADGYITRVYDNIRLEGGASRIGVSGCSGEELQGFFGTTIVVGVLLEPNDGKRTAEQTRELVSDTVFYFRPEIPPEPQGGMDALKKKINLKPYLVKNAPGQKTRIVHATAHAMINKSGKVISVEMYGEAQGEVATTISKAVYDMTFKPGMMLGKSVCSQVSIPFEFRVRESGKSKVLEIVE
jgi:hypothetical protein